MNLDFFFQVPHICFSCSLQNAEPAYSAIGIENCPRMQPLQLSSIMDEISSQTPFWAMYIGDSLLRQQLRQFVHEYKGPNWRNEIVLENQTTYHRNHAFCCNTKDSDTCFYGIEGFQFENITRVIIATLKIPNSFCISHHWHPTFTPNWQSSIVENPEISPNVVVFNQGIHHIWNRPPYFWDEGTQPSDLQHALDSIQRSSPKIVWLYHVTTKADDAALRKNPNHVYINSSRIESYRNVMIAALDEPSPRVQLVPTDLISTSSYVNMTDAVHFDKAFYRMAIALDLEFFLHGWRRVC